MEAHRQRGETISVGLVKALVAALPAASLPAFWRATGLTAEVVADPEGRMTAPQLRTAWQEALALTGDALLPLKIAAAIPPGAFGIVEYVCRSAPTLGDGLTQWARFLGLHHDGLTLELITVGAQAALRVVADSAAPSGPAHEFCFATVIHHVRQHVRPAPRIVAVEFTHRALGDVAGYRAGFDAPVRFDAEYTQIVLPLAALATPTATADPALFAILQRAAEAHLQTLPVDAAFSTHVARILHELLRQHRSDIDEVARRLGTTSRSLQRRLRDEGTSFHDLRERVRAALSETYLRDGLTAGEVAFLLGYSEPSAFFRAFRRWHGTQPSRFLEQQQRKPTS